MATIRIATFNVENLFARWKFKEGIDPSEANKNGWSVDSTAFQPLSVDDKAITGAAVREIDADVIALQEVENVDTLKHFRSEFLGGRAVYPYVAGVDGNDPRLIDVAVLSKLPITLIRSYQHLPDPEARNTPLFSRDCLEVDVQLAPETTITLYVNHLKSMMDARRRDDGRGVTRPKRERQSKAVREIVEQRFGSSPGERPFVVLGDLNDHLGGGARASGIDRLVMWDQVENVVARRPEDEQWTHYWAGGDEYTQLDYILLSSSLARANDAVPEIMRKGQPARAARYTGERFNGVGFDKPKASDHCPVVMKLNV